jgi:hypothetical protein
MTPEVVAQARAENARIGHEALVAELDEDRGNELSRYRANG